MTVSLLEIGICYLVQMAYKFLMLNVQRTQTLTIGGVAPLNMISCVSVKFNMDTFTFIYLVLINEMKYFLRFLSVSTRSSCVYIISSVR